MNLIRWNSGSDLLNLHSELDRLFEELGHPFPRSSGAQNGGALAYLPLDVRRVDNQIEVQASVPGYRPEDVTVTVDSGTLTIAAEGEGEKEITEDGFVRRERYQGRLFRQVVLGDGVNGEGATASFENGVLTVTVPLVARPEPKRIPISAGNAAKKIPPGDAEK